MECGGFIYRFLLYIFFFGFGFGIWDYFVGDVTL